MNRKQAKRIIDKYLNKESSHEETEMLNRFLNSFQSKEDFEAEREFDAEIKGRLWPRIKADILQIHPPKRRYVEWLKYAAIFVGLIAGAYLWFSLGIEQKPELVIEDEAIVLKISPTSMKKIDGDMKGDIKSETGSAIASLNGGMIAYKANENVKELVYNEILVPRGKTFELLLSDGTMVHLNSETKLKFPINFIKGHERQVFLDGEAYFEVTKDEEHPFLVKAHDLNVRVLGTHFVVNSYANLHDYAVLVEGSVAVQNERNGEERIIEPGQKASMDENGIEVKNVYLQDYLGWRTGILVFNDEPFSQIIEKIKRKYNVKIENSFEELGPIHFYGRFDAETPIGDLLNTFKVSAGFDYEIMDNKVIINKPQLAYD